MKKRIISIILILVMLLLPFTALLNARAVTLAVDSNTTNGSGYKVTNVSADGVIVYNVNNNPFSMYKILDVYYDSETNQLSYGFTSSFATFAQAQSPSISVNDYLNKSTTSTYSNDDYLDDSDFNALVSKYAMYVRANNVSATYDMTTTYNSNDDMYNATKTNVEAGAYLILPSSNASSSVNLGGATFSSVFNFSVMIANVVPTASNNDWAFSQVEINAKLATSMMISTLVDAEIDDIRTAIEEQGRTSSSFNYNANKDYSLLMFNQSTLVIPENAHNSIKALKTSYLLNLVDIIYPSTLTPDLTDVVYFDGERFLDANITNNKYYVTKDNDPPEEIEFADVSTSTGKILFDYNNNNLDEVLGFVCNLTVSDLTLSNSVAGNTITIYSYTVKDPYIDIGTVTKADIRAAFDSNDSDYNSTKSVNIRKAIERVENTVTLYATGVTVNNTNSSNSNLSGGEFAVYSTYSNGTYSNQVGTNIVMSNGTGLLNGLDPSETYYLKQVKAPTGYTLYNDKIIVLKGTNDSTNYDSNNYTVVTASNGMYTTTVVNNPVLALPFTGGTGTILYTCIGLFVIIGSAIFMVMYKKRNKKEVVEEL